MKVKWHCIMYIVYEDCPEKVQPLLIQQERFVWHQCYLAAKQSGLGCTCMNKDFTVLLTEGVDPTEWARVLCGCHIQNEWASRATNLHQILCWAWTFLHGNYLDDSEGSSYGKLVIGSFITTPCLLVHHVSCRVFWWNIKSPRWLSPLQPRFGSLQLLAFPKTKITFEREVISHCQWDSGKYNREADGDWENCVRYTVPTLKRRRSHCPMYTVSCILYLLQ